VTPEIIVSDGVARICSKILARNELPLNSLVGKCIKVTKWKMTIKNQKSLFENNSSNT